MEEQYETPIFISAEEMRETLKRSLIAQFIATGCNEVAAKKNAAEMLDHTRMTPATGVRRIRQVIKLVESDEIAAYLLEVRATLKQMASEFREYFSTDFVPSTTQREDTPSDLLPDLITWSVNEARLIAISAQDFEDFYKRANSQPTPALSALFDAPLGIVIPEGYQGVFAFVFAPFTQGERRGLIGFMFGDFDDTEKVSVINTIWEDETTRHIYSVAGALFQLEA